MIKCSKCKRQTKANEPTGTYNILKYVDKKQKQLGTRIVKTFQTCMKCSGEVIK